jgi:hypothetical protein
MRSQTCIILTLFVVVTSSVCSFANEPAPSDLWQLEQERQNICLIIRDWSDRSYWWDYTLYLKLMKKIEDEEFILMNFKIFSKEKAAWSRAV